MAITSSSWPSQKLSFSRQNATISTAVVAGACMTVVIGICANDIDECAHQPVNDGASCYMIMMNIAVNDHHNTAI
jgi:hypothetical protein